MSDYKPEVGKECEVFNQALRHVEWEKCIPLFIGEFVVVYSSESCLERTARIENVDFKPIHAQEEIEREEAIIGLEKVCFSMPDSMRQREKAETLYKAGYRLVGEKVGADTLRLEFNHARYPAPNGMSLDDAIWLLANYDIYRKTEK